MNNLSLGFDERLSSALFSSKKTKYETPQWLFDKLNKEFRFSIDVCAVPENAKCANYFTPDDDCLSRPWDGQVCWMNPPYGEGIGAFVKKAFYEAAQGATVVCLVPARTDTKWWATFYDHDTYQLRRAADEIRFLKGRLKFGDETNSAPFPSAVIIMRPTQGANPWL